MLVALVAQARNNNPVRYRVRFVKERASAPWILDFHAHGKRLRRFFPSEELAWAEGEKLVAQVKAKGIESLAGMGGLTVAAALRVWLKDADPKSRSHEDKLALFDRAFSASFSGPVAEVRPAALRAWVKKRSANANTQAMYYRYARMFFAYLRANGLVAASPMDAVPAPKTKPGRNILTPDQMRAILNLDLPDYLLALFLLGAFAGLRTEEVMRMRWENINAKTGQIHVPPDAIKQSPGGFDQRIVDFTEPLKRRRKFFEGKNGPIICMASETLHHHRRKAVRSVLSEWPDNCLRHSFATYHLAQAKSAPLTAFQLGHTSPAMVQRVYAVPAAISEWQKWWAL